MTKSDRQVVRLRRDLGDTLEAPQWPDGFAEAHAASGIRASRPFFLRRKFLSRSL
jgi:hypothetical protein